MVYYDTMDNEAIRLTLRLPPDLHAKLESTAKAKERSLHSQIIYLLKQSVDESSGCGTSGKHLPGSPNYETRRLRS